MRLTLALAALVVALGGGLFVVWESKREQALRHESEKAALLSAVQTLQKAREVDQAVLARLRQKNASTARKAASLSLSLGAATARNREWAAQPLPEEVKRVLEADFGDPGAASGGLREPSAP